jgi:hypothetical protein
LSIAIRFALLDSFSQKWKSFQKKSSRQNR